MSKKKKDGRRNNRPPKDTQFKPGQSGNPMGRPPKRKSTFEDDIKDVFSREREVKIGDETKDRTLRQLIIEQIGIGAAKGDPKMIKLAMPLLRSMDDAPEFEILPEDKKVMESFVKQFYLDGGTDNED